MTMLRETSMPAIHREQCGCVRRRSGFVQVELSQQFESLAGTEDIPYPSA